MHTIPHVPFERAKYNWLLIWTTRHVSSRELTHIKSERLFKLKESLPFLSIIECLLLLFTLHKSVFQTVEVDLAITSNSELLMTTRVKVRTSQLCMLERQLSRRCLNKILILNIIDRDSKIRHSTHNQKVTATSAETHC